MRDRAGREKGPAIYTRAVDKRRESEGRWYRDKETCNKSKKKREKDVTVKEIEEEICVFE